MRKTNEGKELITAIWTGIGVCMMCLSFALGVLFVYVSNRRLSELYAGEYFNIFKGFVERFSVCIVLFILGLIILVVVVSQSHRRNQEMKDLIEATRNISRHHRLETIGVMASNVNHEFSNLLTPIMGYSLLAMEKVPDDNEELMSDLEHIYEASTKAKDLVSQLLKMSRKGADDEYKCFSPDDLLDKVEEILQPSCPSNVSVTKDYNCAGIDLCANEVQITQVIMNIVINAFQALEKTGGNINISTKADDEYVDIIISDNGPGIAEEDIEHIFDPFFTTKDANKGTGLGLSVVKQIIDIHRGKIIVNSKIGQGTEFIIKLPLNQSYPGSKEA